MSAQIRRSARKRKASTCIGQGFIQAAAARKKAAPLTRTIATTTRSIPTPTYASTVVLSSTANTTPSASLPLVSTSIQHDNPGPDLIFPFSTTSRTERNFSRPEQQETVTTEAEKRLLLNDPDAAGILHNMELAIQSLQSKVLTLEKNLAEEQSKNAQMSQEYGSTYIRWGSNGCSGSNTELVYSGYSAGQIYSQSTYFGGPSNMLCLPNNPELSNKTTPGNSHIYGSEFEENSFAPNALEEDVPCALCRSRNTTTSVMIPGRKTCYNGWKAEYNGRLASSCYACKASSYICVDMNPDYIPGGERNDNHNLLYATSTQCGSLPCPPYHNNLEVFCVVCSK